MGGKYKKIILPKTPHKTSLEVEEISSHRYTNDRFSEFYKPDYYSHLRSNAHVEEPESDIESNSRRSVCMENRSISIVSLSEDENTLVEDSLSHDTPVEDLKFNFNFDETNKSYMQKSSFQDNKYSVGSNNDEYKNINNKGAFKENVLNESHYSYNNTKYKNMESISNLSKYNLNENVKTNHINSNDFISKYADKNRSIKTPTFNYQSKNHLTKEKNCSFSEDPMLEDLFKRIRTQRAALGEILKREGERANQGKYINKPTNV